MRDDYDHLHRWEPSDNRFEPRLGEGVGIAVAILAGFGVAAFVLGIAWLVALLTHASAAWTAPWVG